MLESPFALPIQPHEGALDAKSFLLRFGCDVRWKCVEERLYRNALGLRQRGSNESLNTNSSSMRSAVFRFALSTDRGQTPPVTGLSAGLWAACVLIRCKGRQGARQI